MPFKPKPARLAAALACLALAVPLLACVTLPWQLLRAGAGAAAIPRWSCPTPTPAPFGSHGPVKRVISEIDPLSGLPTERPVYYEQWEQENFDGGGAPFPAPTPFIRVGSSFYLGQLVNLDARLDLQADVRATDVLSGAERLYEARLSWRNRGEPFALVPARQVLVSAVRRADGLLVGGDGWAMSPLAAQLAGRAPAEAEELLVGAGASELSVPILAPDGAVQTLDLALDLPGRPGGLHVQWSRAHEPACGHSGTEAAVYDQPAQLAQPLAAPADASQLVAWAYTQLGRPYCWGGKGAAACAGNPAIGYADACPGRQGLPCWDCSGLTWGAYQAVGITIGHGTRNQQRYPPVWEVGDSADPAQLARPGDLLLFAQASADGRASGVITHVGLYVGDQLMIHAANYPDGVIATPNVFGNRYYRARLATITRPVLG